MSFDINDNILSKIIQIFSRYREIEFAILYGSCAKGNYKKGSDINISLKSEIPLSLLNQVSLELDELFIPYRFDLSVYNEITNVELKKHIDIVGKV